MIKGFENETSELTDYEKEQLLPLVVEGLRVRIGKDKAITNDRMVMALQARGPKITPPRLRKIIHEIRIKGDVPFLIATSRGYYVSHDKAEIRDYVESLHQRAESILSIAKQLEFQSQAL